MDINNEELESVLTLCNSLQLATICLSLDMHITQTNRVAELLFLHTEHELINKSFYELCHKLGIEMPLIFNPTSKILEKHSFSTTHWLSNNKLVDVHWSISRCVAADKYTGYVLVGKTMVSGLPNNISAQIASIINFLPVTIFRKDLQGNYLTVNDLMAKQGGFANINDMIGKSDYDAAWRADVEIFKKEDALAIEGDSTIIFETYPVLSEGKRAVMLVTKAPFKDDRGNICGVVGAGIDITQHKKTLLSDDPLIQIVTQDNSKIYLSKREIVCVNWMIKGKSSSEIANILGISKRTVEAHMNNIKIKLNCHKQFQVGYLLGKYGYLLL